MQTTETAGNLFDSFLMMRSEPVRLDKYCVENVTILIEAFVMALRYARGRTAPALLSCSRSSTQKPFKNFLIANFAAALEQSSESNRHQTIGCPAPATPVRAFIRILSLGDPVPNLPVAIADNATSSGKEARICQGAFVCRSATERGH